MYTLLINENGSITTTVYETIMQRSTNFNRIQILLKKSYKGIDISDAAVYMKYVLPVSKKIKMMRLELASSNYLGDHLQYIIPGNTLLTAEPGEVKVTFSIVKMGTTDDGQPAVAVEKTGEGTIKITPIAAWADYVPEEMLDEIDQRLIILEARQKDQDALQQEIFEDMVDDVRLDSDKKKIVLTNKNGDIGSGVNVDDLSDLITNNIVGTDLDGIQDGVIELDNLLNKNVKVVNLDKLIK